MPHITINSSSRLYFSHGIKAKFIHVIMCHNVRPYIMCPHSRCQAWVWVGANCPILMEDLDCLSSMVLAIAIL